MTTLDSLRARLALTPYDVMTDAQVATTFGAPGSGADVLHNIDVGALERYLASEGILLTLRDEAASGGSGNAQVTAVAREMVALIDSANVGTFDIHHPRAQGGLLVLVNAALITAAQHAAITALGVTPQTIWQEIGVPHGTADDVMRVRSL